jgi:hypothetical protein
MKVILKWVFLTTGYAGLENGESRKAVWLANVPLGKTHELRAKINDGQTPDKEILAEYDATVVASALKLYLLELPGMSLLTELTRSSGIVYRVRHRQEHLCIQQ